MLTAGKQLKGHANFLIGKNESDWQTQVPWYESIQYTDILPGINLTYTGKTGIIKREYHVQPGADPASIILKYEGTTGISLTDDGSLNVETPFGNLTEAAPLTYQDVDGTITDVSSEYRILGDGLVGYTIGEYDTSLPLIIDPYLEYSTYLGGGTTDFGMDIAIDNSGNAYVTGYTSSCDFPVYPVTGYLNPTNPYPFNGSYCHSSTDAYVTKIASPASGGNATILFSTYLGGENADFARGIAVDTSGNMYITGDTYSADFPTVLPLWVGDHLHGQNDAFVSKIRADGTNFVYSTYLGGTNNDQANDIAIDSQLNAYITGQTVGNSPYKDPEDNFPTTSGAYQTSPNPDATMGDAFVAKIGPFGNTLEYSSYISGKSQDTGNGIAVDAQQRAYITGTTSSSNLLPSGVPGYLKNLQGAQDAFLFRMNFGAVNPVDYATYLGGATGYDYGEAVAVDTAFCAYVTGSTASTDFPNTTYAFQRTKGWPYNYFEKDAYVTKFKADGAGLDYSTYLGGSQDEWGYDIAVDDTGRAFITGYTKSSNLKVKDDIKRYAGGQDAFVGALNDAGSSLLYLTYLGGYRDDVGRGIAITGDGSETYVTGYTGSPSFLDLVSGINCDTECFPVTRWINQAALLDSSPGTYVGGNFTGDHTGSFESFVVKFGDTTLTPSFTPNETCGDADLTVLFTDNSGSDPNIVTRIWSFGDGNSTTFGSVAQNVEHTYNRTGIYPVTLTLYTYTSILTSDPTYITVCNADRRVNFTAVGYNSTVTPIVVPVNKPVTYQGERFNYTPATWEWYFGDGTANQTQQVTPHTFTSNGTYPVTLTGTSCCGNLSIQRTVVALGPPFAEFVASTNRYICQGGSVSFTATPLVNSIYGPPSLYDWNFGDNRPNQTSITNTITHQFDRAGNFTITLTVSNVAGSYTTQRTAYVGVGGNVSAFFDPGSQVTGTTPHTVNFTDQSTGSASYWRWEFGDGFDPVEQRNTTHTYTQIGEYRANLTVWGCGGAPSFWNRTITVNGNISPTMILNKTAIPAWNEPLHAVNGSNATPFRVYFLGNTSDGSLIDEAWWNFGDGSAEVHLERVSAWPGSNLWVNTSHNYTAVGDYTPVLRVRNNTYGSATSGDLGYHKVGVYGPTTVNFSITDLSGTLLPGTPPQGLVGVPIQFHNLSTGGGGQSMWKWEIVDESPGSPHVIEYDDPNPVYTFTTNGEKWVTLSVWNKYNVLAGSLTRNLTLASPTTAGTVRLTPENITVVAGANNWRRVNIALDRADYGLSNYRVVLDLNSTASANFGDATYAQKPEWVDQFNVTSLTPSGLIKNLSVSGFKLSGSLPFGSTNVPLGNVTIFGSSPGGALITFNTSSNAGNGSYSMTLTGTTARVNVYKIDTFTGESLPPQDTDHDGYIDDFNGNGRIEFEDVTTFFRLVSAGLLTSPVPPFDYQPGNGINTGDIVAFYDRYW